MIANLIFDLDGTLLDSFPGIAYSAQEAMAQVLPGRKAPDFRPFIGPPIREIYRRALGETDEGILRQLEQAYRASYDFEGWRQTRTYPDVTETLQRLIEQDFICFVLTNKPRLPTLKILENLKLDCYFKAVMTPDMRTPCFTSKSEAAHGLCREFKLRAGETLLVGDSPDDAAAAADCGFAFAGVAFGYGNVHKSKNLTINFLLNNFRDLATILKTQNQFPNPIH